ncbi:hypothetical protein ZEAMMB73_Zm00001d048452, partial [Zea mays]
MLLGMVPPSLTALLLSMTPSLQRGDITGYAFQIRSFNTHLCVLFQDSSCARELHKDGTSYSGFDLELDSLSMNLINVRCMKMTVNHPQRLRCIQTQRQALSVTSQVEQMTSEIEEPR